MLETLEKAFYVIGDRVMAMSVGNPKFDQREIYADNITNELVIRPTKITPPVLMETRETLSQITKRDICNMSLERFGVELNYRLGKPELISMYLKEQDIH